MGCAAVVGVRVRPGGWRRCSEGSAPLVREGQSSRLVGVAVDAELGQMVAGAEADEVGRVTLPAVLPVPDVVDVQPAATLAAGSPAAPVPVLDHHPCPFGDGAERPSHAHRLAAPLEHRPHPAVAREEPPQGVGKARTEVEVAVDLVVSRLHVQ